MSQQYGEPAQCAEVEATIQKIAADDETTLIGTEYACNYRLATGLICPFKARIQEDGSVVVCDIGNRPIGFPCPGEAAMIDVSMTILEAQQAALEQDRQPDEPQ